MDLSIVILHYQSIGLLKQCLKGIFGLSWTIDYEVIVVDNNHDDVCQKMVKKNFPEAKFILAGGNLGYAGGMNLGLRQAKGKYILILNPDIVLLSNDLQKMIDYLDKHQSVGLLGPKLLNPDGSIQYTCYRWPSFLMPLYRRTFLGRLPGARKKVQNYLMADWDHRSNRQVDWLLGGCLLARQSAIKEVGLFDERFFLYVEDIDWSRRFWERGWSVVYFVDTEIVHYHQRTSAELNWWLSLFRPVTQWHVKSWLKYFLKYRGLPLPLNTNDIKHDSD